MPRHLFFLKDPSLFAAEPVDAGGLQVEVPEWVNVLPEPINATIASRDGRTLHIDSMEKLARRSNQLLKKQKGGGPVDADHSIYGGFFTPGGGPAIGWAEQFEARPGKGLWAKVDWLEAGRKLVGSKEYRYTSAVVTGETKYEVDEKGQLRFDIFPEVVDGFAITNIPALVTTSMFSETGATVPIEVVNELLAKQRQQLTGQADADNPPRNLEKPTKPIGGNEPPLKKTDEPEPESLPEETGLEDPVEAAELVEVRAELTAARTRIAELETEAGAAFVESLCREGKLAPAQRAAALAQAKTNAGLAHLRDLYANAVRIVPTTPAPSAALSQPTTPWGVSPLAYQLALQRKSPHEIACALRAQEKSR